MKQRKKTYILLAVVLAIWGILGFRVVKTLKPEHEEPQQMVLTDYQIPENHKKRDTFSIDGNYRDPFLGKMPNEKKSSKVVKRKAKATFPTKNITYLGSVGDKDSKNKMFFVNIEGQQHVLTPGQKVGDVVLISGDNAQIKVRYPGHTKIIKLTE